MSGATPSIAEIQRAAAEEWRLTVAELLADRRQPAIVRPRQVAMALAAELTPHSLPVIGRLFAGRDHTTVLHAVRSAVPRYRREDPELDARYRKLKRLLAADVEPEPELQPAFFHGPLFDIAGARAHV